MKKKSPAALFQLDLALIFMSNAHAIEVAGAKRRPPSDQRKFIPPLKCVLPPLTKNPGYVAGWIQSLVRMELIFVCESIGIGSS